MLQKLYIKNFAIIKEASIDFTKGMTAITGETGAGKSILLGALQLILGARADMQVLLNNEEKCVVEAFFSIKTIKQISTLLERYDIDCTDELIIRREISTAGRSRSFINDTPASVAQLNELGNLLIDLHRQFDTLELKDKDFKREVLDILAINQDTLSLYQKSFFSWKKSNEESLKLIKQKNDLQKEYDYNLFLYNELSKFNFSSNEIENLENDLSLMSNAESLKKSLLEVKYILSEGDEPILTQIKKCIQLFTQFSDKIAVLKPLVDRLNQALVEIKDINNEVDMVFDETEYDEEKLNLMLDKYNEAQKLLKKHNKQTTDELIQLQTELESKLSFSSHLDDSIFELQKQIEKYWVEVKNQGAMLTKNRKAAAIDLENRINELLPLVGMTSAKFKTQITTDDYYATGADTVEFLIDSNNRNNFQPLSKVASGGELSRLMLCVKSLLASNVNLPTLIFDEIDTGISGEAAKQVGLLLQQLSLNHQVICVTHLPQIASKSNSHLYIYKSANDSGELQTQIKYLNKEERINHIAEMLSGDKPTPNAIKIAKEMIEV